jgi:predicted RNase H-like nuclease
VAVVVNAAQVAAVAVDAPVVVAVVTLARKAAAVSAAETS